MSVHQALFPIATMCRVLGVSSSGYYAWRKREPSERACDDARLTEKIKAIHKHSRGTYGAPRIHRDLRQNGVRVGCKRVARLMKAEGLAGVCRRKGTRTTLRQRGARSAPDLVDRDFTAEAPDTIWVADITYIPTWSGFLFLAVVLDVWSRRVVGWAMAGHMRTELVLDALKMAVDQRHPESVIHHSDHGSQYTASRFREFCEEAGVQISMGSIGDAYDNAMCESFFATLECELIDRSVFRTQAAARMAVFDFIEGWYNPHRRHSALDYLSPAGYERRSLEAA